jgi:N-acetylmuramoyl-L-alanine amidase
MTDNIIPIIDAGHSGTALGYCFTRGKEDPSGEYKEGEHNRILADAICKLLWAEKMPHVFLNPGPVPEPESLKVRTANELYEAHGRPPMVYCSLHSNAGPGVGWQSANGQTIFVNRSLSGKLSTKGSIVAETMMNEFRGMEINTKRGVQGRRFYVLRKTKMPAILHERGFHTSREDLKYLTDPAYVWELAERFVRALQKCRGIV